MPELPEVETIRRELDKELSGLEIKDVVWNEPRLLRPVPEKVKETVVGARFTSIERRAKLFIFRLTIEESLLVHLRMTGRLLFRDQGDPSDKYVAVTFKLSEGKELRFANARKFGYIKLATPAEVQKKVSEYGPEPLDSLTLGEFKEIVSGSGAMIKNLLMDQKKIAGVGNIYANDALFLARIHPEKKASSLSEDKICKLFHALEQVLKEGLETRGASDQWYRDAYGEKGSYQDRFKVYGKVGEDCPREDCEGKIKRIKVGGRGTFFCSKCQKKST